jgi:hypothetical protein
MSAPGRPREGRQGPSPVSGESVARFSAEVSQ